MQIYLDNNSTTQLDPSVFEVMKPYFIAKFGNPSSNHSLGKEAKDAVEEARATIAKILNTSPNEIIFTSSATEANNLAIKGVARQFKTKGNHIITCMTEHKSVLEPCQTLRKEGFEVTFLPVERDGLIDLKLLKHSIKKETILISIMHVNNEIGVIQPIEEIGRIAKEHKIIFHTDAAQSCGKFEIDVQKIGCDLLTISGHKMHGPKGVAALYVRKFAPRVKIKPLIEGGGQENSLRAGTINVPLVIGLAKALEISIKEIAEQERIFKLREDLRKHIINNLDHIHVNGSVDKRIAGNLSISFGYIEGESLVKKLNENGVIVSTGSACSEAILETSHVLKALGLSEDLIHNTIRFGLSRFNTQKDVQYAQNLVVDLVRRLQTESPAYQSIKGNKNG